MHWVIQNNMYGETKCAELLHLLRQKNISHDVVKIVPFFDKLLPGDFDSHGYHGSIDEIEEVIIPTNAPIFALGGTAVSAIAKKRGWSPGSFLNENFHYEKWCAAYGALLLNAEGITAEFLKISPPWPSFFLRPCEDTKDFPGIVLTQTEWKKWRKDVEQRPDAHPFHQNDVMASPVKTLFAEYRLFVVDGVVATGTQYKKEDVLYKHPFVPNDVMHFTNQCINTWQPARAFVLDVARTDEGLRVIEINNINSAGFYEADMERFIEAIEGMTF